MINVAIIKKKNWHCEDSNITHHTATEDKIGAYALASSATALHARTCRTIVLNGPRGEFQTLHADFSETKAHALKRSDTFYTLDPPFRINYGSSNSVFYNSRHFLVSFIPTP